MAPATNLNLERFETMIQGAHYMAPANYSLSTNFLAGRTVFPSSPISNPLQLVRNMVTSFTLLTNNCVYPSGTNDTGSLVCSEREHILRDSILASLALWLSLMVFFGTVFGIYAWIIYRSDPSIYHYTDELTDVVSFVVDAEADRRHRVKEHRASIARCEIVNKRSREIDIEAGHAFAAVRPPRPESPRPFRSYSAMERRDSTDSAYSL